MCRSCRLPARCGSLGVYLAQKVFDAGTLAYKQRAAEEAANQSLAQYRSIVLAAFQNVADVLSALQSDARAIAAATTAEHSARQNVQLIQRQLEQGLVNVPILIEAQRAYLDTATALVDARASRFADTVALFQALGGGWWNSSRCGSRLHCGSVLKRPRNMKCLSTHRGDYGCSCAISLLLLRSRDRSARAGAPPRGG